MTNDMQSTFGIVDDGSTDKTIKKVQQFDKALNQTEGSADSLTEAFLNFQKQADGTFKATGASFKQPKPQDGGGSDDGGGRGSGVGQAQKGLRGLSAAANLLGDDAGAAASKITGMGGQVIGLADSVSQMGLTMGPVGIAAAAASVALGVLAFKAMGDVRKQSEELVKQLQEQAGGERALLDAKQMTSAEIEKELADIASVIDAERELGVATQGRADATNAAIDQTGLLGDAIIAAGELVGTGISDPLKEVERIASDQAATVTDLETRQTALNTAYNSQEVAANDAAEAAENYAEASEKTASAMQQLAEQESNLIATRKQALDDLAVDRSRRDSRASEDAAEAAADRADQRAESARKDAQATAKINQAASAQKAKTLKSANDALIKNIIDSNKASAKLEQEFSDKAIEEQNKFNERQAQAANDFRNAEFDAIQENDIIGALRAQRDFEEQQKQDLDAASKETQLRETEKQKRLAELRDEQKQRSAEIRANLAMEIAEQQNALQARLKDQAAARAERTRQDAKADAKAEKSRAKQQRRQAEDDALADERSERAFEAQLKAIEDKKQAEQQALAAVFSTIGATASNSIAVAGQAASAMIQTVGVVAQTTVNSIVGSANSAASGFTPMAEGGIVTSPTLALIGEGRHNEAVIPLDANGGIPGIGQSITINLTTADIATGEQVGRAIQGAMGQMAQVDIQVLANSLAGVAQ